MATGIKDKVAILGMGCSRFGERWDCGTEDLLNDQQSNFNQMVGMVLAIELSHHYLGQYKKYSDTLAETALKSVTRTMASSVGREVGRTLLRGILGSLRR